jgi:hypothetical protein
VISYIKRTVWNNEPVFIPFWANTSENRIVKTLLNKAGDTERKEIETLLQGGVLKKIIHTEVTYEELYNTTDNIWNILFFTGYLKKHDKTLVEADGEVNLSMPNNEVKHIYRKTISAWFEHNIVGANHADLYEAMLRCDTAAMTYILNSLLRQSISFMDKIENFYHGFMTGILSALNKTAWSVKSNRETGDGRSDIIVHNALDKSYAAILELKAVEKPKQMAAACEAALQQIEEKNYVAELEEHLFTPEAIHKFGIAFCGKECMVKKGAFFS